MSLRCPVVLKKFPSNFKVIFSFAGRFCVCHNARLTYTCLFWHSKLDFDQWFDELLAPMPKLKGEKKRKRLAALRRENYRLIERLVDEAQKTFLK